MVKINFSRVLYAKNWDFLGKLLNYGYFCLYQRDVNQFGSKLYEIVCCTTHIHSSHAFWDVSGPIFQKHLPTVFATVGSVGNTFVKKSTGT